MSGRASTHFSVAVHVLTYLAGRGRGRAVSSDELSESANVHPVYIRQVLAPLRDAQIVRARRGAHGGWELARPSADIHLDEIFDLTTSDEPMLATHGPSPECSVGREISGILSALQADVASAVRAHLRERTVEGLVSDALLAASNRATQQTDVHPAGVAAARLP